MGLLTLKNSKLRKLFIISSMAILLAWLVHKPLPENITQREKLYITEPILRFTFYYPVKLLGYFGFSYGQVVYTRKILSFYASLVNKVSIWRNGGIKMTTDEKFDNIPVRVYIPAVFKSDGAVIFMHGGGFVISDVDSYDGLVREISRLTGMVTVSINYRLAPEHLFPTAVHDCENAVVSFMNDHYKKYGVDNSKVVLMGDSAGGNLAAVLSQRLTKSQKIPHPIKLQVLIYPFVQLVDLLTSSYQYIGRVLDGMAFLDPESGVRWVLLYLGIDVSHVNALLRNNHVTPPIRQNNVELFKHLNHAHLPEKFRNFSFYYTPPNIDKSFSRQANDIVEGETLTSKLEPFLFNPDFSPMMAPAENFQNLPPALIITCEFDTLRDEGFWYYRRLKQEGVDAKWIHYDQGFHGVLNFHSEFTLAQQMIKDIAEFIHASV